MADVITRLKVDSSEYDKKLQRATVQMQQMEREVRRAGESFAQASEEDVKFAQSLGAMEAKAVSATGKISEMTKTFTELSLQYRRMTDEEKRSPYGKALASSLDQLKGRIKDAKSELSSVQGELSGVGDVFKQLGGKMGIPIELFTKLGPAVAAASAAIKIATDAFKQNEILMDEWGRTTQAAGSLYQGFLNSINTGDISGFLKNIGNIITKAREAYDALDELGTFNAFNQIQVETARTNFNEAITNYREGSGSKEDVKTAAQNLKNELQTRQQKEQDAYICAIRELAESRGVDAEMLTKALSGTYGDYETLKNTLPTGERMRIVGGGRTAHAVTEKYAANETEKLGEALRKLNDEDLQRIQALGAQAQRTSTEISQIDRQTVRILGAGGGSKNTGVTVPVEPVIPEGSAAALKQQISELQKAWNLATTQDERDTIKGQIDAAQAALDQMIPKVQEVGTVVKDAAAMWQDHTDKVAYIKARLEEFKRMMSDSSLSEDQRKWATDMYEMYQKQLDKMTGATEVAADNMSKSLEKVPTRFELIQKSLDNIGSYVDGISTIGNAFDELKDIGEDLSKAFSGEMDTWDALMTVFKSGISIMETVIGVMEAINTLTELSTALKEANTIATETSAATSVAAAATEAGAETTKAAANMTTAGTAAAASASEAGESVAGIPIVGPILAVAAIAAVLAATFAAISKAKSATKFANGGMVGGNSYSGDNIVARLNSGEGVLTARGVQNAAIMASNSNSLQNLELTTDVSGTNLLIVLNNTNRSRGGSRNFYSKVH